MTARVFFLIPIFCLLSYSYGRADNSSPEGDKLVGRWLTQGQHQMEVYKKEGRYFAKPVLDSGNKGKLDSHNPDETLRNRSLTEVDILRDLEYIGKNRWGHGTVYLPGNGKTYRCRVKMKSDGKIKVRGFAKIPLFGKTETCTRISPTR